MSYWDEKQYWADACTRNCVWLFQVSHDKGETFGTQAVFIKKEEAIAWGESRPYAWGEINIGWRVYGVPCCGLMAELLAQHKEQFTKV